MSRKGSDLPKDEAQSEFPFMSEKLPEAGSPEWWAMVKENTADDRAKGDQNPYTEKRVKKYGKPK